MDEVGNETIGGVRQDGDDVSELEMFVVVSASQILSSRRVI